MAITGCPRDMYSDSDGYTDEIDSALREFAGFVGNPVEADYDPDIAVFFWNDRLFRTEEQVLDAFRRFAEIEGTE
ncbi:hypothetical protein A6A27_32085 [Micromonospora sp. CB01531]|nr:hypothetical protein A6A27_32085 [Micromonospora sp. CB01531]